MASDDDCDDGGPGALYSICEYGTDCTDCGVREFSPPPASSSCPDLKSTAWCTKKEAKGKCTQKKVATNCRSTCDLCNVSPPPAPCSHARSTGWCVKRQTKCNKKKIAKKCSTTCAHCAGVDYGSGDFD